MKLVAFQFDFCAASYAAAMGAVVDDENEYLKEISNRNQKDPLFYKVCSI